MGRKLFRSALKWKIEGVYVNSQELGWNVGKCREGEMEKELFGGLGLNLYYCYVLREMWVKKYGKVVQVIGKQFLFNLNDRKMENLRNEKLEFARSEQKRKNETKKRVNGRLQDVVEHQNGVYRMIAETENFFVYENESLGSVETIDKAWKSFPSNEQFGTKSWDFCFSSRKGMQRKFPNVRF